MEAIVIKSIVLTSLGALPPPKTALVKLPNPPKYCSNVKRHHVVGDSLSMANKGYGEGYSYKTAGVLKSHSLQNFLGKNNPISKFKQNNTERRQVGSSLG